MKTFSLDFEVLDKDAILKAAAEGMVRLQERDTIEEAIEFIAGNVNSALRLILDQAACESAIGDFIEIHDSSCEEI